MSENASGSEDGEPHESPSDDDDREALAALRVGRDDAWETLWLRHYTWLRSYAGAYLRAHAEADDIASEALTRTLVRFSTSEAPRSLRSYLKTVARHIAIDLYRQREREAVALERSRGDLSVWEDPGLAIDERRRVVQTLRIMPERQRYVLIRLLVDGLSIADLADELDLTPNATSQLAFRARKTFRRLFGDATSLRSAVTAIWRALTLMGGRPAAARHGR
ncbi:sigma-70 family RNA polymerase sigma factor [Nocardioides endophyticus]|uniref:RNA polymerase sigma factor n=1 Tax=Nocardioides endophyticus TaxID=1353775 RepID=UPI0031EA493A